MLGHNFSTDLPLDPLVETVIVTGVADSSPRVPSSPPRLGEEVSLSDATHIRGRWILT
jgi:hypothetical protein